MQDFSECSQEELVKLLLQSTLKKRQLEERAQTAETRADASDGIGFLRSKGLPILGDFNASISPEPLLWKSYTLWFETYKNR